MGSESWLSRIRKKIELKRTEKLRKKYEFLIKEINNKSDNINEQISSVQREQQVSRNEIKVLLDVIMKKLDDVDSSVHSNKEHNKILLDDCSANMGDRLQETEGRIILHINETSSCTQGRVDCVQADVREKNEDIQGMLKSILNKIEIVQNDTCQVSEKCNAIAEENSRSILLSIDEIKALMKIVAVNNLLDEM